MQLASRRSATDAAEEAGRARRDRATRAFISRNREAGRRVLLPLVGRLIAGRRRPTGKTMNRTVLTVAVVVLACVAGFFAYRAYERDQNSLQIEVGPQGVKVDPPG